jgi:phage replication O-like protein O
MSAAVARVISMDEHRRATPQLEDGYVRIANELFDAILSFKFTYRQLNVLLAVIRKTYGYGKKTDDISASQIGAMCGMPRPHVASTLVELEQLNVLTRERGKYGTITAINKNYREWVRLKKRETEKVNEGFGGAVSRGPADRLHHYVYRLDHEESGTFYIGVRSCDCSPNQDRYKGSGCWTATIPSSEIKKTILSTHESRDEAEVEEKRLIRLLAAEKGMGNKTRYVSGSDSELVQNLNSTSTESVQSVVQNLYGHVVQKLNTQKTTLQKTTPKDNPQKIAQSADCAASAAEAFEQFWQTFGYKKGRAKAEEAFAREYAKAKGSPDWLQTVMQAAAKEAQRRPHLIADGQTPIYAQGWLSQRRYEDEDLLAWGEFSAEQQSFIDCFNANIGDACPQVTEWTEKRAALCDIAMRGAWSLDRWAEFWRYVRDECAFGWPVSFEWMLNRENWAKVKGGQYLRDEVQA